MIRMEQLCKQLRDKISMLSLVWLSLMHQANGLYLPDSGGHVFQNGFEVQLTQNYSWNLFTNTYYSNFKTWMEQAITATTRVVALDPDNVFVTEFGWDTHNHDHSASGYCIIDDSAFNWTANPSSNAMGSQAQVGHGKDSSTNTYAFEILFQDTSQAQMGVHDSCLPTSVNSNMSYATIDLTDGLQLVYTSVQSDDQYNFYYPILIDVGSWQSGWNQPEDHLYIDIDWSNNDLVLLGTQNKQSEYIETPTTNILALYYKKNGQCLESLTFASSSQTEQAAPDQTSTTISIQQVVENSALPFCAQVDWSITETTSTGTTLTSQLGTAPLVLDATTNPQSLTLESLSGIEMRTYTFTVTATYSQNPSLNASYDVLIDVQVCPTSTLLSEAISDLTLNLDSPPTDINIVRSDQASLDYGAQDGVTLCGARSYSVIDPSPQPSWLSIDQALGIATVITTTSPPVDTPITVKIGIQLANYPTVSTLQEEFKVTFTTQCSTQTLTLPNFAVTSLTIDTYNIGASATSQSFSDIRTMTTLINNADCGDLVVQWEQSIDGGASHQPIDTQLFAVDDQLETISYETSDVANQGLYVLYVTVSLADYPSVVTNSHYAFEVTFVDGCSSAAGYTITVDTSMPPADLTYFFNGTTLQLSSQPFVPSIPNCPITYECERYDDSWAFWIQCGSGVGSGSSETFDSATQTVTAMSTDRSLEGVIFEYRFRAIGGTQQDVIAQTADSSILRLSCMVTSTEFLWNTPLFEAQEVVIEPYRPSKVYNDIVLNPLAAALTPFETTVNGCTLQPITSYNTRKTNSSGGAEQLESDASATAKTFTPDLACLGVSYFYDFSVDFLNLLHTDLASPVYPTITRQINCVDGTQYLAFDQFMETNGQLIDLSSGPQTLTYRAPTFQDGTDSGLTLPIQWGSIALQVVGGGDINDFIQFELVDNASDTSFEILFSALDLNTVDTFHFQVCFTYSYQLLNSQNLCDNLTHQVTGAKGLCFVEFEVELDWTKVDDLVTQSHLFYINETAETNIVDLSELSEIVLPSQVPNQCGSLGYKLLDETQSFLSVTEQGVVTMSQLTDSSIAGNHQVQFAAYLQDIDSDALYPKTLDFTLSINIAVRQSTAAYEVSSEVGEAFEDELTAQSPVPTDSIAPAYIFLYDEFALISFEFIDSKLLTEDDTEQLPSDLEIKLVSEENTLPGIVNLSSTEYAQVGYGKITLSVDGVVARQILQEEVVTNSTETEQKSLDSGTLSIQVRCKDVEGAIATYKIKFEFHEVDKSEEELKSEEIAALEEELTQAEAISEKLNAWREEIKRKAQKKLASQFEQEPPRPTISLIESTGEVEIRFDKDIQRLPSLDLITKGTVNYRGQTFPVLQIEVIPHYDQDPQNVQFSWEVSGMDKRAVRFRLKFKSSIYISQQEGPDVLKVTFRDPFVFVGVNGMPIGFEPFQRMLSTQVDVDEDFITLTKELPPQIQLGGFQETLKEVLTVTVQASSASIISNFVLNALISGSLNKLWSMINTQQLIVMLPLFVVIIPSNAQDFFQQVMTIAAFDFYEFGPIVHDTFSLPLTEPLNAQFNSLGFESKYLLVNMGTLMLPWIVQGTLMIIHYIIHLCNCHNKSVHKLKKTIHGLIYWRFFIALVNESYMIVTVCLLISIRELRFESAGLTCMSLITLIFLALYAVVPAIFLSRIGQNFDKLKEKKWLAMYGTYYENLSLSQGKKILYQPSFFMIRRIMVGVAVCLVGKIFIWQLAIFTAQIIMQVNIIGVNIYPAGTSNSSHYLNEIFLMFSMYTFLAFTPWVQDINGKVTMGYLSITLVVTHFVVNLAVITFTSIRNALNRCKRRMFMAKHIKEREKRRQYIKENRQVRLQLRVAKRSDEALAAVKKAKEKARKDKKSTDKRDKKGKSEKRQRPDKKQKDEKNDKKLLRETKPQKDVKNDKIDQKVEVTTINTCTNVINAPATKVNEHSLSVTDVEQELTAMQMARCMKDFYKPQALQATQEFKVEKKKQPRENQVRAVKYTTEEEKQNIGFDEFLKNVRRKQIQIAEELKYNSQFN